MKKMQIALMILLLINGISATIGSVMMLLDPSGGSLNLPPEWLKDAPFPDYTWPAVILLVSNGLLSLFIARITYRNELQFAYWAVLQGFILCGWLTIQIIMLGAFYAPLHITFYAIGAGILVLGLFMEED
jgi:hypothetical protein